ncbi:MAG: pentapeptide repeat-containing protein [Betaproteobacteria bacterium]|nr:pentapeptide repeat-containing protein [Betaproteobacteria bacterium]
MPIDLASGACRADNVCLAGSTFTHSSLEGAKFHDVNLRGAEFVDVALTGARLSNLCLGDVTIADANLARACGSRAFWSPSCCACIVGSPLRRTRSRRARPWRVAVDAAAEGRRSHDANRTRRAVDQASG